MYIAGNRKALVTLAVGPEYALRWRRYCSGNWMEYAKRHGYDVICLENPLDAGFLGVNRPVYWQKHLILSQEFSTRYERLVWVDADILFGHDAPCVVSKTPPGKVGAVDEYSTPGRAGHTIALQRLYAHWTTHKVDFMRDDTAESYYTNAGLPDAFPEVVQAGMLVLSPRHHRELLEHIYYSYTGRLDSYYNYEMRCTSHALLKAGVVHWLDWRFNAVWNLYKAYFQPGLLEAPTRPALLENLRRALYEVHLLHFAGEHSRLSLVDQLSPRESAYSRAGRGHARQPPLETPVVLCLFARPDSTARVLEQIRRVRPRRLLVIADGPRGSHPEDAANCTAARKVIDRVDWDCDLSTHFSDVNLGIRRRMITGLTWAFSRVDEAIILEDDCVPSPTFFRFCREMLERFRDDPRVMSISGNNFEFTGGLQGPSYRFSRYPLIWGWATWRRAWTSYDGTMRKWPELRDTGWLERIFDDPYAVKYWSYIFQATYDGLDTWDYQLLFASLRDGCVHAHPRTNLVSNVGFGSGANHTLDGNDLLADIPAEELRFPLQHPARTARDRDGDDYIERVLFSGRMRAVLNRLHARINRDRGSTHLQSGAGQ